MSVIELAVSRADREGTYEAQVVRSPAGEGLSRFTLDAPELGGRRDELQASLLASAVSSRALLGELERPVREVGRALFTALLAQGQVASVYRASAALADERGEPLRVVLRLNVPELATLPWEAMFDADSGTYVCRQELMVRLVPVAKMPAPLRVQGPLRILGVASSPRGLPTLDVEKEQRQLARSLRVPMQQGRVHLHWAAEATWPALQDELLGGTWHVIHFIGHGDFDVERDEGVLALVGGDGRVARVGANRFADLLREAESSPRLVILNACKSAASGADNLFSGTAAALVRSGISAVAAMQFEISDQAAIAFSRGFYAALAQGRGVDQALASGRRAILGTSEQTLEWVTPLLYLRGEDARLFAVDPAPAAPVALPVPKQSTGAGEEGPLKDGVEVRGSTSFPRRSETVSATEEEGGGSWNARWVAHNLGWNRNQCVLTVQLDSPHEVVANMTRWRDTLLVDGREVAASYNHLGGRHDFFITDGGGPRRATVELVHGASATLSGYYRFSSLTVDGRFVPISDGGLEPGRS